MNFTRAMILVVLAGALQAQIASDASGRPMDQSFPPQLVMRLRAFEFAHAWDSFVSHILVNQMEMADYVHACEKAKVLFPMLKGNCRDRKQLDWMFSRR